MSLLTTWTVRSVPPRPATDGRRQTDDPWTCVNCDEPNTARRRRCYDCGTVRDR
ncbi:MAG: hypothetical protein JWL64_2399 [Frankiales bacterium]|nr:hypothetical protein [Frankiales bacterium]